MLIEGVFLLLFQPAQAQIVPMLSDDPVITQNMDTKTFDFISTTLGSDRMRPEMRCTLRTRNSRELRHFSNGEQWVETLDIDFNSNGFDSGQKIHFKIPMTARYGVRRGPNPWSGVGEDMKIEVGDNGEHWIRFTHDGNGHILKLNLGNNLQTFGCEER